MVEPVEAPAPEESNNGLHFGDEILTAEEMAEILGELDGDE